MHIATIALSILLAVLLAAAGIIKVLATRTARAPWRQPVAQPSHRCRRTRSGGGSTPAVITTVAVSVLLSLAVTS
jgi:hypothetical protein